MDTLTVLFIVLAGIVALGVSVFQYYFRAKKGKRLNMLFAFFRFITLFALLLLLIDPSIKSNDYYTVKPVLALAIDNSASIEKMGDVAQVKEAISRLSENDAINSRFDVETYTFGESTHVLDSLAFAEKQTNIAASLRNLKSVYRKRNYLPVLITDGNANIGEDYRYVARDENKPVYFLAVGDTVQYEDLQVDRVNVNRYAYLDNQFPVEVITSYYGDVEVNSQLVVSQGNTVVHRENISYSPNKKSHIFNFFLPAASVGVKEYTVTITALDSEKNTNNNTKVFAVEVLDQRSTVAIISSVIHPDLGALKNAIQSNKLRNVEILDPSVDVSSLNKYDLVILFEPNRSSAKIIEELKTLGKNTILVMGPNADVTYLNSAQEVFKQQITNQADEAQGYFNPNFNSFQIENFSIDDYPPLETNFGRITLSASSDIAVYQSIGGVQTKNPLIAVAEEQGRRQALIFGTGIWKWRAQSYRNLGSFETFDNFIDKLVQYAASTTRKTRLRLEYDNFYYGGSSIKISAQYFNKNYVFDPGERLNLSIFRENEEKIFESPMIVKGGYYEAGLPTLEPGKYNFTVAVDDQNITESGAFTVVPYNIEDQYSNADWARMSLTAKETQGKAFTLDQQDALVDQLLNDDRYRPVQKSVKTNVTLIDFRILLILIAVSLAAEWFLRKYNGLI